MAIQMTAKERLLAKAAANKAQQDKDRAAVKTAPDFMQDLIRQEQERKANENAQRVRDQRARVSVGQSQEKAPVSDRAKKMAEIRADIDTTPAQGKAGKAAQSIGLNAMASVQYLGETAKQFKENTDTFMGTQEAEDYAAAVSEFNRVRRYAMEDSPEYIAAQRAMEQARARMEQASAEAQSETVNPDSLGSRMMGESMRLKEEALEGTEGAGRFLAETGMSVASNLAKLPLGAAAPVLMGAEAAAGKAYELQQQGVGAGQALMRGTTSGVIEGITEKMGLDTLADLVTKGGKSFVINMLKQAGVEGTEEGFSYVFNLLADKAAKDPNAKFNWDELKRSIASGAVSGLFFGAAGTAANRAQADPGVIEQTDAAKQAPKETKEQPVQAAVETVEALPVRSNTEVNAEAEPANAGNALELPVREIKTPEKKESLPVKETKKPASANAFSPLTQKEYQDLEPAPNVRTFTQEEYQKYYPNSPFAQKQQPQGLPQNRQESLQQAFGESVGASQNLEQVEKKTGLPLPSDVQGQLAEIETLVKPMDEDADEVANTIRKYMGEEAANYWLEHKDENAEGTENPDLYQRPTPENSGAATDEQGNVVGTQATEKLGIRIEGSIADMSQVQKARQAQWGLDVANKQIEQAEKELRATSAEKRMAENVAKGIDSLDSYQYGWDGKDNRRRSVVEELSALYRLRDTYDRNAIKALGRHNKDVLIDTLNNEILNHVNEATPPSVPVLRTNTWTRNNLRTWGRELGEKVNRMIFDPIKRNEANRIRWVDQQASDMAILGKLTDAENEAVFDMLDNGKETATYDGVRNEAVQEAADKLRQKYSQYYDAINDMLVAHGYPEIGFIKNYAPHKQPEQMKTAMSIFEKLGISDTVTELPTEIAGRTDTFKPGKKWNPHFLHRTGDQAALDAVGGYLSYLNYMSEVMFHVDDIQRVRTFGDQIRYLYGDEGLQADYDAIRADTSLNEQEKELELARIRERQTDNSKMGGYVTQLDDYANILAGKQTIVDRSVESGLLGRLWLNVIQKPVQMLVKSSVPGNLSSAINQTVQLPWLAAEAGEANVVQAAVELAGRKLNREGFAEQSDFVTGKRGAENLQKLKKKSAGEKALDIASLPFEAVDDATSQIIVRAFYLKNVKAGMDHESAMRKADRQAERLVGSRMKGAKANVFSDKSLKLITTFQLEVANQWQHLKQDLPQEYRDLAKQKGNAVAAAEFSKRVVKGTLYAFALNQLIEQITGNRPVGFDIIGIIRDYILAGAPEEEEGKFDWEAGLEDVKQSVVDDLPFVGNLAAMVGIGDGRLPLPSVDRENIQAGIEKKRNAETKEEKAAGKRQLREGLLKSAATMLPMGNQIKKTIQGTTDLIQGGRYTNDGTRLMYEVEQSPANIVRGVLFGRNALPEAREYWEQGKSPLLSEKQTTKMKEAETYGVDRDVYLEYVTQAKTLESDKDENGKTIDGSLARKKTELIDSLDITDEQKLQLYLDNVASDSKREDAEAMRDAGMTWDEILPALGSEKEQRAAVATSDQIGEETKREVVRSMLDEDLWEEFDRCVNAGVKTEDFVQTRDFYSTTYADKDANGKSVSGSKKKKVWGFIDRLDATPAQKDALSVACGYDSKLNEAPWNSKASGLPMPSTAAAQPALSLPSVQTKTHTLMLP